MGTNAIQQWVKTNKLHLAILLCAEAHSLEALLVALLATVNVPCLIVCVERIHLKELRINQWHSEL